MTTTLHSDDEHVIETRHPFEGLPNGEERFAKAQLAHQINLLLEERGLKQWAAVELLGITQPEVSNLATGRLSGFRGSYHIAAKSAILVGFYQKHP